MESLLVLFMLIRMESYLEHVKMIQNIRTRKYAYYLKI